MSKSSSSAAPMSMSPSLFRPASSSLASKKASSSAPKKQQGRQPRKQKPVAAPPKNKSRPKSRKPVSEESDEGDEKLVKPFFIITDDEHIREPVLAPSAGSVIQQSKRKTFKFSEGDTDEPAQNEPVDEPETKSAGSPRISETDVDNNLNAPFSGVIDGKNKDSEHSEGDEIAKDEEKTDDDDDGDGDDDDDDDDDYKTHHDHLEAVIDRRLFKLPCTAGVLGNFREHVKSYILDELRGMLNEEPSPDIVLEIADSIDLLRLLGGSNHKLDVIGGEMGEGVAMYCRGMEKVNEGQDLLRSAIDNILESGMFSI